MSDLVPIPPGEPRGIAPQRQWTVPAPPAPPPGDATRLWRGVRRQWWVLLLGLAVGVGGGTLLVRRATPRYEAVATLRLADSRPAVPGLEALEAITRGGSEVTTEQAVLASRTLARRVVDSLVLRLRMRAPLRLVRDSLVTSLALAGPSEGTYQLRRVGDSALELVGPDSTRAAAAVGSPVTVGGVTLAPTAAARTAAPITFEVVPEAQAVTDLLHALTVARPSRDVNILHVRYEDGDPVLVQQVPNTLVAMYIARRTTSRKTGARSTVSFLQEQLDALQGELRSAEDSLRLFKERDQGVAIEEQTRVSVGRLAELQAQRGQVAAELTALEATMDTARREAGAGRNAAAYRRLLAFPTLLRTAVIPSLLQTLTTLETERATLRVRRQDSDRDLLALTRQIEDVEEQVAGIVRTYATGLREQVSAFDKTLSQSGAALREIPARELHLAQLVRSTTVLGELSTVLQTRLKEAQIAEAVDDATAEVVDLAEYPRRPVWPRPVPNLAFGGLLGLLLGGMVSWGREGARRATVQDRDALLAEGRGLPVLGIVPRIVAGGKREAGALGRVAPHSPAMEAYRALRTSMAYVDEGHGPQVLLVTSPLSAEGKSTSVANLAAAFAQQGGRTLVIDADLRRGSLHSIFGVALGRGVSDVLAERAMPAEVVQEVTALAGHPIAFVSRGAAVEAPAELLAGAMLEAFVAGMRPHYDHIIIDSPPVNVVADTLILARMADGVVVVTRGGQTRRGALRFALDQLASVRAPVVGTLLNAYDARGAGDDDDYHRYYYGAEQYGVRG